MKKSHVSSLLAAAFFVLCVALAGGCSTASVKADQNSLKATAERYWNLRMGDKYSETYKMEDEQGLPAFEKYQGMAMAMKKLKIVSISVKDATVTGEYGSVELEWSYMLTGVPKPFRQVIKDEWLFKGGRWLHIFKRG